MTIRLVDERCDELSTLGFISVDDGNNYLHATVDIYNEKTDIYFGDFLSGNIGKYNFQADRRLFDRHEHNGKLFQGAGRGRKPDKAFDDMKEFIYKVSKIVRTLELDESKKVNSKKENIYYFEF